MTLTYNLLFNLSCTHNSQHPLTTHTHTYTTHAHMHTHTHVHTHVHTYTGREIKALIKKQLGAGRISSAEEEEEEGGLGNVGEGEPSGSKPSSRSATPTSILEGKGELQKNCQQGTRWPHSRVPL